MYALLLCHMWWSYFLPLISCSMFINNKWYVKCSWFKVSWTLNDTIWDVATNFGQEVDDTWLNHIWCIWAMNNQLSLHINQINSWNRFTIHGHQAMFYTFNCWRERDLNVGSRNSRDQVRCWVLTFYPALDRSQHLIPYEEWKLPTACICNSSLGIQAHQFVPVPDIKYQSSLQNRELLKTFYDGLFCQ